MLPCHGSVDTDIARGRRRGETFKVKGDSGIMFGGTRRKGGKIDSAGFTSLVTGVMKLAMH